MSGLVISLLRLLFGLMTGLAAGAAYTALLWRQVRRVTPDSGLRAGRLAAAGLLRVFCAAAALAFGVRLGFAPALAALGGFWLAVMYRLWPVAFGRKTA